MKRIALILACVCAAVTAGAEIRSYTITFGAEHSSTQTLDNSDFMTAVAAGRGYIEDVTSVVNVFPETDCVKLGSSKNNGKFNIHLTKGASIIPEYYVINAKRHNSTRDESAMIMINSETAYVPSTEFEDIRIDNPAIAPHAITNLIVDADKRIYIHSISVYYDTANGFVEPEKVPVATPVFTPAGGSVSSGSTVIITCATEDAEIYYTTDGAEPSEASKLYDSPVTVDRPMTLRAIALKDGMAPSEIAEATFTVVEIGAEQVAFFNFNDPASLTPQVAEPATSQWVNLDGRSFTDMDAAITFGATTTGNTHVRLYHSYDAGCDVRIYDGETLTLELMNPSLQLVKVEFTASDSGTSFVNLEPDCGEIDIWEDSWTPGEDETVTKVVFTSMQQTRLKSMLVYMRSTNGIPSLDYNRDEEATYYNINGHRVDASTVAPGFYIRVTRSGASKVIIR